MLPVTAALGGGLGGWIQITFELVRSVSGDNRTKTLTVLLPFLRYVAGGLAGFVVGYLLPVAALNGKSGTEVYNSYFLLLIATLSGFSIGGWLASLVFAADGASPPWQATEGSIRRVLGGSQLVQFRGFLSARLIDGDRFDSCMIGGRAQLRVGISNYRLELTLQPDKGEDGLYAAIVIEEGIRAPSATFDLEVVAEGLEPLRNISRITGSTGRISESVYLSYSISNDVDPKGDHRIRISVRQSGRIIQFASMQLVLANGSPDQSGPGTE